MACPVKPGAMRQAAQERKSTMTRDPSQDPLDLAAAKSIVGEFDKWFQYAETIGQTRLGSFLFAASITLAAFATLYSRDIFLLSSGVAMFGIFFSFAWLILGLRQGKFHEKIETQIDFWLRNWESINEISVRKQSIEQFPIWHVRNMKKDLDTGITTKLSWLDQLFRTRRFLWVVPSAFLAIYVICSGFALRQFLLHNLPSLFKLCS
jgi:hypothetical protein